MVVSKEAELQRFAQGKYI